MLFCHKQRKIGICDRRYPVIMGVTAEYGDRLITLSTCEYSRQNGRMVVVAKKIGFALFGGGRK